MLIKSLENHVLKGTEMKSTQITAAQILLKKVLPDLSAVEVGNSENESLPWIGPTPLTPEEWEDKYGSCPSELP